MSVSVVERKEMAENTSDGKKILPQEYGCQILLEKTTIEKVKDPSYPTDAYLIWYLDNDEVKIDLVRGSQIRIFDMYHDKYGSNVVQKIDFGYGKANPKIWGYKQPEKKKRK